MALRNALTLIGNSNINKAEQIIFESFDSMVLQKNEINTLGYSYLTKKGVVHSEQVLASLIFKYNVINFPENANVFDSYGESLLVLRSYKLAKNQFLKAITTMEKINKEHRALIGYRKNLAKAESAIK